MPRQVDYLRLHRWKDIYSARSLFFFLFFSFLQVVGDSDRYFRMLSEGFWIVIVLLTSSYLQIVSTSFLHPAQFDHRSRHSTSLSAPHCP